MPTPVKMPRLGESVAEGTIGAWIKQVGDYVERDEALAEIIALEQAGHRVARREPDHALCAQLVRPFRVEKNLRPLGIEDLEYLLLVGLGVGEDRFARERRARLVLAGWITDHAGEIADQELHLMTETLKIAQLVDHHGVAKVQVRRRRVEAELYPQLSTLGELLREFFLDD